MGTINNTGTFLLNVTDGNNVVLHDEQYGDADGRRNGDDVEGLHRYAGTQQYERWGVGQREQPDSGRRTDRQQRARSNERGSRSY